MSSLTGFFRGPTFPCRLDCATCITPSGYCILIYPLLSHTEPQTKLVSVLSFFLVQAHWFGYVMVLGFRSGCHWFDFSVVFL
ncbi:hypothetical protein BDV41DRAFT_498774 [Aspergillus transmontanensis]|uniref:Uncharacterized protein n=1 Tax=Aspergillus transmontanensis TaxID=1034304 RepID=A0A5N6VNE0_9EURO|nr:hypothetical protein BDV41DRAFT_498774 [Aspergillus transmontanensis]